MTKKQQFSLREVLFFIYENTAHNITGVLCSRKEPIQKQDRLFCFCSIKLSMIHANSNSEYEKNLFNPVKISADKLFILFTTIRNYLSCITITCFIPERCVHN